jgi:hypothetical protein
MSKWSLFAAVVVGFFPPQTANAWFCHRHIFCHHSARECQQYARKNIMDPMCTGNDKYIVWYTDWDSSSSTYIWKPENTTGYDSFEDAMMDAGGYLLYRGQSCHAVADFHYVTICCGSDDPNYPIPEYMPGTQVDVLVGSPTATLDGNVEWKKSNKDPFASAKEAVAYIKKNETLKDYKHKKTCQDKAELKHVVICVHDPKK